MDFPYFIKEHLWMCAYDEAPLKKKKKFGGSKPSSKLTLKTKWFHGRVAAAMVHEVVIQITFEP